MKLLSALLIVLFGLIGECRESSSDPKLRQPLDVIVSETNGLPPETDFFQYLSTTDFDRVYQPQILENLFREPESLTPDAWRATLASLQNSELIAQLRSLNRKGNSGFEGEVLKSDFASIEDCLSGPTAATCARPEEWPSRSDIFVNGKIVRKPMLHYVRHIINSEILLMSTSFCALNAAGVSKDELANFFYQTAWLNHMMPVFAGEALALEHRRSDLSEELAKCLPEFQRDFARYRDEKLIQEEKGRCAARGAGVFECNLSTPSFW